VWIDPIVPARPPSHLAINAVHFTPCAGRSDLHARRRVALHGAAPDRFMTHLSITEGDPHWGDHVTDAEYHGDSG
jgi:hypothetical protein